MFTHHNRTTTTTTTSVAADDECVCLCMCLCWSLPRACYSIGSPTDRPQQHAMRDARDALISITNRCCRRIIAHVMSDCNYFTLDYTRLHGERTEWTTCTDNSALHRMQTEVCRLGVWCVRFFTSLLSLLLPSVVARDLIDIPRAFVCHSRASRTFCANAMLT